MQVDIRHGLTGEEVMQMETGSNLSGWDVMVKVAAFLGLQTPFQVVVNPGMTPKYMSPLHITQPDSAANCREIFFIIRPMQDPTAAQFRDLIEALYQKNAVELARMLGQGLDLTLIVPDGGHTSALLTLAMLKDHDPEGYMATNTMSPIKYPCPNACLTFLILQAKADPNILPPKQQPTTMIGLAVALRNQALVGLLLDAAAEVHPDEAMVPPLIVAVLHQDKENVQALLSASADPWRSAPVGALLDRPWSKWVFSWQEPVSAVQVAAAQGPEGVCADLLTGESVRPGKLEEGRISNISQPLSTALSERATMLLAQVIEDYKQRTGPHRPRLGHESLHWRKVMAGLYLPKLPIGWLQSEDISAANCPLLRQVD
jgi:hypothetical protein